MKILIEESALRQALEALEGINSICSDSRGVTGYHLNGDIAEWGEFDEMNQMDISITALRTTLDAAKCQRERDSLLELKPNADMRELCAACQMALDALESCINDPKMRHTDTVHYATQDAHDKLREVLK